MEFVDRLLITVVVLVVSAAAHLVARPRPPTRRVRTLDRAAPSGCAT